MAAIRDILQRAERLGAAVAAAGTPAIINCKGVATDLAPVLLTLAEYERLTRAAQLLVNAELAQPAEIAPDW